MAVMLSLLNNTANIAANTGCSAKIIAAVISEAFFSDIIWTKNAESVANSHRNSSGTIWVEGKVIFVPATSAKAKLKANTTANCWKHNTTGSSPCFAYRLTETKWTAVKRAEKRIIISPTFIRWSWPVKK